MTSITLEFPTQKSLSSTDFKTNCLKSSDKFMTEKESSIESFSYEDEAWMEKAKNDFQKGKTLSSDEIKSLLAV